MIAGTAALREFPKLSSRAIAELCGVSDPFVMKIRPEVLTVSTCERTGQDGKRYPARRQAPAVESQDTDDEAEVYVPETAVGRKLGPPADGPDPERPGTGR